MTVTIKAVFILGVSAALLSACAQAPFGASRYGGSSAYGAAQGTSTVHVTRSRYGHIAPPAQIGLPPCPPTGISLHPCGTVSQLYRVDRLHYEMNRYCCGFGMRATQPPQPLPVPVPPPVSVAEPVPMPEPAPAPDPLPVPPPAPPVIVQPEPIPPPPVYIPPPQSYPTPDRPPVYDVPRK